MKNEINGVRILKKGVRFDGKYIPVQFTNDQLRDGRRCITIRSKSYIHDIPKAIGGIENNSDMLTDYFEKDRVRFFPGSAEFEIVKQFAPVA